MKKLHIMILSFIMLSVSLFSVSASLPQKQKYTYYIINAVRANSDPKAIKFLEEGLKEYPNHITIMSLLADRYAAMGDLDKANSLYDSFILNNQDDQVKSILVAFKYKLNGNLHAAIKEFTSLLELSPPKLSKDTRSNLLLFRGKCYLLQKDYQKALQDLSDSIAINPQASTYGQRAEVYEALGKYDLADKDNKLATLNTPKVEP